MIRPDHYGGADSLYEAIKVIEAWGLGFNLGNVAKYLARAGKKPGVAALEDLKKAQTYLAFEISRLERQAAPVRPDYTDPKLIAKAIEEGGW